ncbi:MAG: hypothetical protein EBX40_04035, partial [Gammaproteobacteria bacterium]|nr:hypothetical protein [Gammaproteobacteria bacterium]
MNVYARYGFLTLLALTFLMLNAEYVHHLLLPGFMIYDVHRILQLLCFLSMLVPFLVSHRVRTITLTSFTALPRLAKWLLVIFFAWGLLSALHSPDSRHALTMVCHFFLITVLGFFVAGMVREWPNATQNWLLGTFILGIGTYLITEYVNYIFLKTHPELLTPLMRDWDVQLLRFYGYSNPRFLGQILSWTLPIVVLPYLHFKAQNRSTLAFFFLLLAGAWWQMMWLGESRNEYLQLI